MPGKALGTFGCLATQSFHETKNFTCGEGGALLLNDPAYISRAEVIWEKGTNRLRFLRAQVEKYTWMDLGSYLMAEPHFSLRSCELVLRFRSVDDRFGSSIVRTWRIGRRNAESIYQVRPPQRRIHIIFFILYFLRQRSVTV